MNDSCLLGLLFTNKNNDPDCFDYSAVQKAKLTIICDDSMATLWNYWWSENQAESRARQNPGEFPSFVKLVYPGCGLY